MAPFDCGLTVRDGPRMPEDRGPPPATVDHHPLPLHDLRGPERPARCHLTVGDAHVLKPYELTGAHAEIEAHMRTLCDAGATPVVVGGGAPPRAACSLLCPVGYHCEVVVTAVS